MPSRPACCLLICAVALSLALSRPALAQDWTVTTLAGNGQTGFTGDGGPATAAAVSGPFGVVVGPDGAVYVCEIGNHVVRRIDPQTGRISTVAGSGKIGYAGDGGPATSALCNEPYEVRFDAEGNMFFVEMQNHLVRRVDAKTKVISTVAGTGTAGFSGDGGPARSAQLKSPHSIALDGAGGLFIADIGNHRIRRVDLKSGQIDTVGGTGERARAAEGAKLKGTPLDGPRALDFADASTLWLGLREGNAVYRVDLKQGILHHIAGTGKQGYSGDGGPARDALLSGPKGIAFGPGGDIYLADTESHTIRVIHTKTGIIETIVGTGKPGDGPDGDGRHCQLGRPHGVFVDSQGRVYIGDSDNHKLRVATPGKLADEVVLFNGTSLVGWRDPTGEWQAVGQVELDPADATRFQSQTGTSVLTNGREGKTVNLVSAPEFGDCEAHIEFCVPKGSNSGVYFQGRYEIQVLDSFGKTELKYGDNGGVYRNDKGFEGRAPAVNVSRAPGEWQTFDVVFRAPRFDAQGKKTADARFLKVIHNAKVIHENVAVNGPTTAATYADEQPTGPIMLQGDHGPVAYRNLRIRRCELP